jgi:pyruvate/2-oxoglutarate dehydrogenase complex dihydrolipoamide acyltransferase (E2) component
MQSKKYIKEAYGIERKTVEDSLYLASKVHKMEGFGEVDITKLRNKIRTYRKENGINISIITVLLFCYAKTLNDNIRYHALKSKNKLYLFEEVDVFFPFEIDNPNSPQKNIARKIIRSANKKTMVELQQEIDIMQQQTTLLSALEKQFMQLPWLVRKILYNIYFSNPLKRKSLFGNAYFSAIANVAPNYSSTSFPIHFHSIGVFFSPIKTTTINNQTVSVVNLTVSADHAIINGSDLARFTYELLENIKNFSF